MTNQIIGVLGSLFAIAACGICAYVFKGIHENIKAVRLEILGRLESDIKNLKEDIMRVRSELTDKIKETVERSESGDKSNQNEIKYLKDQLAGQRKDDKQESALTVTRLNKTDEERRKDVKDLFVSADEIRMMIKDLKIEMLQNLLKLAKGEPLG